jgi:hypothetical protein
MTPEELDLLQEELEEYLPTSLQSKLDKIFEMVRNTREEPIRKEWVENQKRILDIQNKISWNTLADYPQKTTKKPQKNHKKLNENQKKPEENQRKTTE